MTWNGEKLRMAREAKGMNQSTLAELLGVEPPTISRWESGTNSPRASKIPTIASLLGKDPSYFHASDRIDEKMQALEARLALLERAEDADEQALLDLFRQCSPSDRKLMLKYAKGFAGENSPKPTHSSVKRKA